MKRLLLLLTLLPCFVLGQHTLSGTFSPAEKYKWGILYEVTATSTRYTGDARMDESGKFSMDLTEKVSPGVYRFVYGVPPEDFNFDIVYNGKEDIAINFDETNGLTFMASEENMLYSDYQIEMYKVNQSIDQSLKNEAINPTLLDSLFQQQRQLQEAFEVTAQSLSVGSFIKASKAYAPEKFVSKAQYFQKKKEQHFAAIDVTDSILQKSSFLLEKAFVFIEKKEDIKTVADFFAPASDLYQKTVLEQLWRYLGETDQVDLANELGMKFLSPIAKRVKDTALVNEVFRFKQTSIGSTAPNFSWKDENEKTIWFSDLKDAENYILVFWSSTCSHCLKELPKLHRAMESVSSEKYQVIAFGIEDDIYNWKNETYNIPNFLHVPGLGKWDNDTSRAYNITKTPTYFILNNDKVITAKPEDAEALIPLLQPKEKDQE